MIFHNSKGRTGTYILLLVNGKFGAKNTLQSEMSLTRLKSESSGCIKNNSRKRTNLIKPGLIKAGKDFNILSCRFRFQKGFMLRVNLLGVAARYLPNPPPE